MKTKFYNPSLLTLGILLTLVIGFVSTNASSEEKMILEFKKEKIEVEIADETNEKAKGLSGRESLKVGKGMLFVFKQDGFHSFWMKDMKFSIDMLWLDKNLEVVHIEHSVSPDTYPKSFKPEKPARYVLEVPSGYTKRNSITLGSRFEMSAL